MKRRPGIVVLALCMVVAWPAPAQAAPASEQTVIGRSVKGRAIKALRLGDPNASRTVQRRISGELSWIEVA